MSTQLESARDQPHAGVSRGALPLALVLVTAGVVLLIYRTTFASMVGVWLRSETFAHGLVILPVAIALLVRRRVQLAQSVPAVDWWAVVPLAACVAVWLVAAVVQADVVAQLAMMAMIPVVLLLVLGRAAVRAIAFPLLFALLAVPVGEFLIAPMMNLTANGSVMLLQLSGVPVYQDGWLISIPAGNFQVADACSGVRYLIGAVTTGVLFAYLFFRSWKKRIFFMIFTIVLTIMANVLRAYIIILLAHLTEMRLAVGVDHFIYGWFLFSLLLLVVLGVGLRFADGPEPARPAAPLQFVDVLRTRSQSHALAAAIGIAVLISGPFLLGRLSAAAPEEGVAVPARLATAQLAGETGRPSWLRPDSGWRMRHLAFAGTPPFEVHLFRGGSGPSGHDLTALREQLAPKGVTLVADDEITVPAPGGGLQVRQMRLQQGRRGLIVGYWFAVGSGRSANPVTAKLLEIRTMLAGEHKKPALIAVVLETNGLDRPGASLNEIIAELAAACRGPEMGGSTRCDSFVPVSG